MCVCVHEGFLYYFLKSIWAHETWPNHGGGGATSKKKTAKSNHMQVKHPPDSPSLATVRSSMSPLSQMAGGSLVIVESHKGEDVTRLGILHQSNRNKVPYWISIHFISNKSSSGIV